MIHNPTDNYQPPHHAHDQHDTCSPCPTCSRLADDPLSVPFDPSRSALLDWIELLEDTLQGLKRAVEAGQPPSAVAAERKRALTTWADVAHRWEVLP
jgi:hypothetical protein